MKLTLSWLQDWIKDDLTSPDQVAHALTMAGLEIDAQTALSADFSDVVVGEVLETQPHPDADKLKICQVCVGDDLTLTIVCGAKNVAAGQKVPVAQVGATLPNGIKIKKAKLRGIISQGMICAESELGLPDSSEGIMVLSPSACTGGSLEKSLGLPDTLYDIAITPNRGDCFSLCGVARELAALSESEWAMPPINEPQFKLEAIQDVRIQHEDCTGYASCLLEGIDLTQETPQWMKNRLLNTGYGLTNLVVDVINYVMLETGQPMHGFDFDKLSGTIEVACSSGESFNALNQSTCSLDNETMIIKDEKGVLAIAGVIGGLDSAIAPETTRVLLESARFSPQSVRKASKQHQFHTESSHRFERGVDPKMQLIALNRVVGILQMIDPAVQASSIAQEGEKSIEASKAIVLTMEEVHRILGINVSCETAKSTLGRLGFEIEVLDDKTVKVTSPSHRFDINYPVDLIEELARMIGYDTIPMHALSSGNNGAYPLGEKERVSHYLKDQGFNEAICLNMLSEDYLKDFTDDRAHLVALENPLNTNMTHLRHSLIPGLLQSLQYNVARQQARVRLFEVGDCFINRTDSIHQVTKLAGIAMGDRFPLQWDAHAEDVDFFDMKHTVMTILAPYFSRCDIICKPLTLSYCHQNRSCVLEIADKTVGHIATLHPKYQKEHDLPRQVVFFEIELTDINQLKRNQYLEISKHPSVGRDLALVLPNEIRMNDIVAGIRQLQLPLLKSCDLFDIYTGDGVKEGYKSLALRLTLQHPERTLLESEVSAVIDEILDQLKKTYNVSLR